MDFSSYEQVNYDVLFDVKPILTNFVYTNLHWHKEIEIVFVCQGAVLINVQGEKHTLGQGDIYIINSEMLHSVNSVQDDPEGIVFLLQIGEPFMRSLHINIDSIQYNQPPASSQALNEIRSNLLRIIEEIKGGNSSYKIFIHSYCCNIIALLTRGYLVQGNKETTEEYSVNAKNLERIKRIFTYIQANYSSNPSLAQVAAIEYVNPYYLSHIFTKTVGINYTSYLDTIKVDYVKRDLIETSDSVTDIMSRHGFSNSKTFNRVFKKVVGCSPSEYRRSEKGAVNVENYIFPKADSRVGNYLAVKSNIEIPDILYKRIYSPQTIPSTASMQNVVVEVNASPHKTEFAHYYQVMTAAGRAVDFLRADVREHFCLAQREIHFQYVRFHGIFDDEMCILDPDGDGTHFNFSYVDNVFDFLLSIGLRPFVEFTFMPTAIASGNKTVFFYHANISPPRDIRLWENLISAFMSHIMMRYTREEVRHWYFEVWNEPSLSSSWDGDIDDYMNLYQATAIEVKKADPSFRVGGPAAHGFLDVNAKNFLEKFLLLSGESDLPVDFVSAHLYPAYYYDDNGEWKEKLCGPEQTKEDMLKLKSIVHASSYPKAEIYVDEWNNSSLDRDLLHDTAFMAVFIIHNFVNCSGLATALTYWTLSDLMEESSASSHEFHGGFGLLNQHGLKKPSYFAFYYLSRLSHTVISRGSNFIVTTDGVKTQILVWNYCHYKEEYAAGDYSLLSFYKRYEVLEPGGPIRFSVSVPVEAPIALVEKVQFDREHGSVFDLWLRNGAIEYMTPHQLELIREQNLPARSMDLIESQNGRCELSAEVQPLGFTFFEISPENA